MSMEVSKTTVYHWIVASTICVHYNSLKPILTEENKWARLEMALHFRDHEDPIYVTRSIWMRSGFFSCGRRRGITLSLRRKPKMVHKTQIAYHKGNVLVCCCGASIQPLCQILVGRQIGNLAYWGLGTRLVKLCRILGLTI